MLSSSLIEQPASLRATAAEGSFYDILNTGRGEFICLDRLEILFDQALMLKPLDLVRNASRRFVLLASWPGEVDANGLSFGPAHHPSHFHIPLVDLECPVHSLSNS